MGDIVIYEKNPYIYPQKHHIFQLLDMHIPSMLDTYRMFAAWE